jgi:hypothetical protein
MQHPGVYVQVPQCQELTQQDAHCTPAPMTCIYEYLPAVPSLVVMSYCCGVTHSARHVVGGHSTMGTCMTHAA